MCRSGWSNGKLASSHCAFRVASDSLRPVEQNPAGLWYRASAKNVVIFALMWLGEFFLILMFLRRVFHGSTAVYLLVFPWASFGLIMVARPNWILRATLALDKALEDAGSLFEKRPPPGFP
jgi:hypothetical protein